MASKPKNQTVENEPATETTAMTISEKASAGISLPNGVTATVVRKITLPLLKQEDGETVCFTVQGPMFTGKKLKTQKEGEQPATIVNVINAENHMEMQYLVPAVLKDSWETDYPDNTYVGKSFACQKLPKREGKRHKDMNIVEVELS